jgi:two-component system chemotaxis sensor kinase CheA
MDELSKEEMNQVLAIFREQTLELLDEAVRDLLAWEEGGSSDVFDRLRRTAHTIKGDAACVGLKEVAEAAHRVEDLLSAPRPVRSSERSFLVDQLLASLDCVRSALERGLGLGAGYRQASTIRVTSDCLDEILGLAEEMRIAHSRLSYCAERSFDGISERQLRGAISEVGRLVVQLQKSALKMRMVAIGTIFGKLNRAARELARELGKQVELKLEGAETKLDRALVDLIYEPLLHLLRNAIDHGLEFSDQRCVAGKPAVGCISIRAYHEGSQVVVEVSDDGRGIDPEALKARAVQAGVIQVATAQAMSDEQALELVFHPAISTADHLSMVSGRGIGCSAARAVVTELGGWIGVRSSLGLGTTFILRVPLTLAIIRILCFVSGGWLLALPLTAVSEVVQLTDGQLVRLGGFEWLDLTGGFIPVVRPGRLSDLFGSSDFFQTAVIAFSGARRFAIAAEAAVGISEVVIKPIGGGWAPDWVTGAGLVEAGCLALVVDSIKLYDRLVAAGRRFLEGR